MKRKSSSNDSRYEHPYRVAANWLPGGPCCFWNNSRNEAYKSRMNAWAESIQGRVKENLITNNKADLF